MSTVIGKRKIQLHTPANDQDEIKNLYPVTTLDNVVRFESNGSETSLASILADKADKSTYLTNLETKLGDLSLTGFGANITDITKAVNDLNNRVKNIVTDGTDLFDFKSDSSKIQLTSLKQDATDPDKITGIDFDINYVNGEDVLFNNAGMLQYERGNLLMVGKSSNDKINNHLVDSGLSVDNILQKSDASIATDHLLKIDSNGKIVDSGKTIDDIILLITPITN